MKLRAFLTDTFRGLSPDNIEDLIISIENILSSVGTEGWAKITKQIEETKP